MCGLSEARLKKCRCGPLAQALRLHFCNLASNSPHLCSIKNKSANIWVLYMKCLRYFLQHSKSCPVLLSGPSL